MNELLARNLEILSKNNPAAAGVIEHARSGPVTFVTVKNGDTVGEVNVNGKKFLLHSKFDPVTEAGRFVGEIVKSSFNLYVVAGFGFGYHIAEILAKTDSETSVLVLESHTENVRAACESRDLSKIFSDPRFVLMLAPSEEEIADRMRGRSSKSVAFVVHRGSHQTDPESYDTLIRLAKSFLSTKDANIATLTKFEKLWTSNIARNAVRYAESPSCDPFFDTFKGLPAIIVCAGPSLTESIPFIKKNVSRAVIVAVDTAYFILRRYGIEPHFCLCVDPQVINARYFEGSQNSKTIMVADSCAHPSVFRLFKGRVLFAGVPFDTMKWIESSGGARSELAHGGSVSTTAYDFAKRLGCAPLVLTGQDLAFTKGLAHARGSYLDEQVHLLTTRIRTPEMHNRFQLSALPKIMVSSLDGGKEHTNQKMMIFLNWFSRRNDSDLVNATRSGAEISGVARVREDELNFVEKENIDAKIDSIMESARVAASERSVRLADLSARVSGIQKGCRELSETLSRAVSLAETLIAITSDKKGDAGKINYILGRLTAVDKELESFQSVKDMVGLTVQRVIHSITEGYSDAESTPAESSLFLYKGMAEGCDFCGRILDKMEKILSRV